MRVKLGGTVNTGSTYGFHMNASVYSNSTYNGRQATNTDNIRILENFYTGTNSVFGSNTGFILYLYRPWASDWHAFTWQGNASASNLNLRIAQGAGSFYLNPPAALSGIRFFDAAASSNFNAGSFSLYRIKNA